MNSLTLDVRNTKKIEVPSGQDGDTGALGLNPGEKGAPVHGLVLDEVVALAWDEGQNSSNGWRLREHFLHGLDNLAIRVEGVLVRNKVIVPEVA